MTFFEILSAAQKIYALYGFIGNTLTDHVSLMIQKIAKAEMASAIKTLEDSKVSNNREREFASAVTQLRLALEKTKDNLAKAKITAIIWFCYTVLKEEQLARSFENDSLQYFNLYYEKKLKFIVDASNNLNAYHYRFFPIYRNSRRFQLVMLIKDYNNLVDTTKDIGLDVVEKKIDSRELIVLSLSLECTDIGERATRIVESAKTQYAAMFRDSLPSC